MMTLTRRKQRMMNDDTDTGPRVLPFKVLSNDNEAMNDPNNANAGQPRDIEIHLLDGTKLSANGFLGVYPDFIVVGNKGAITMVAPVKLLHWAEVQDTAS